MSAEDNDRGIPSLRSGAGMSGKVRIMVVAFVVLFFLVVVGLFVYTRIKAANAAEEDTTEEPRKHATENRDTDLKEPPGFVRNAMQGPREPESDVPAPPTVGGGKPAEASASNKEQEEADRRERRQRAPVLAFSRGEQAAGGAAQQASGEEAPKSEDEVYQQMMMAALSGMQQPKQAPPASSLGSQLHSDEYPSATASRDGNPSFMVRQGTVGRCVMRTSFNSQLAGFSSCILSEPLYSADGRFVMAEAGSEVTGTYQTGQVKPGVSRAFVLWNQLRTPHGVRITLDSPATDGMGQTGITGRVNNHFFKRFGSGLLLSLVDDMASQASGSSRDFRSTGESMNQAAAIAVENNVNIPPTIQVKAGAIVNIFVARDLDFSSIYSASLAEPRARN